MARAPSAKNQPVLLRLAFPRSDAGPKTGTGALAVSSALGLTSGGVVNSTPKQKVARILQPLNKNRPQILLSSAGENGIPAPQTGTGALSVSVTISGSSGARNFFDLGSGDALNVSATISNASAPGTNRIGTGALAVSVALSASPGIRRSAGSVALVPSASIAALGTVFQPGSSTGTGALVATPALGVTAVMSRAGTGVLVATGSTAGLTGNVVKTSSGTLAAQASITGTGTSSIRWDKYARAFRIWRRILRSRSST